jgi:hypothetical protein
VNTYGKSSPWTSASDQDEPASEDQDYDAAPDYDAASDPAAADQAGTEEPSGDAELSGAPGEEVVVVESVHTGDQASADDDVPGSEADDPPFRSTAASDVPANGASASGGPASGDLGGQAAPPSDYVPAGSAVASETMPAAGDRAAEWSEIKALFVDDPGASVRRASSLVEHAVDGFMESLRQRQDALSSWREGDATGTEDLRVALRGYRGLFDELERMSGQFSARSAGHAAGEPAPGAPVTGI